MSAFCETCGNPHSALTHEKSLFDGRLVYSNSTVTLDGNPIPTTKSECIMIAAMMQCHPRTATKDFLIHYYEAETRSEPEIKIIDVFVCKIRTKLRKMNADIGIETVWGVGYNLVGKKIEATGSGLPGERGKFNHIRAERDALTEAYLAPADKWQDGVSL